MSVGWSSGVLPVARPISPKVLVAKVLVTVNWLVGASSSPSWASRAAAVVGNAADHAVTTPGEVLVTDVARGAVTWVCPENSNAVPTTWTPSPRLSVASSKFGVNTKIASEAPAVASTAPPVPAVCMKKPLKPPLGYFAVTTPLVVTVSSRCGVVSVSVPWIWAIVPVNEPAAGTQTHAAGVGAARL